MKPTRTQNVIVWLLSSPGDRPRTQMEAAAKFGLSQGSISKGLKRYAARNDIIKPDARRRVDT